MIGSVYIPPENSKYSTSTLFDDIEREIVDASFKSDNIILLGDLNARTGSLDLPNFDQWNELKDIPTHVPTSEITKCISKDVTVNSFGRKLIALCSNLNLYILNGRIGIDQKNIG